jgi:hypothetical protein
MTDLADNRGPPAKEVTAKRPADKVPLQVDWHDYLAVLRKPGVAVAIDTRVRPPRAQSTGKQYRCTTAGVTASVPTDRIRWPSADALTVLDGSVVWTAEPIDSQSLRATVLSNSWAFQSGITKSDESNSDLIYTAFAADGADEHDYEVIHSITLSGAPAETKEALIILPVRD